MLDHIRKFMIRNWVALTVGFTITAILIWIYYPQKGYIGAERFIAPTLLFISININREKRRRKREEIQRQRDIDFRRSELIRRYINNVF